MQLYMSSRPSNHVLLLERQAPATTAGRSLYHLLPTPKLGQFSIAYRDRDPERQKSLNSRQGCRIPQPLLLVLWLLGQEWGAALLVWPRSGAACHSS